MRASFAGFDWDSGNRSKCARHGVACAEIESIFGPRTMIRPDLAHSVHEQRFMAIGPGTNGRKIFVVFTIRLRGGRRLIRPISARYMHLKEVRRYEEENP